MENRALFNYVNLRTLRLKPDDVGTAEELFEKKFGRKPRAIALHKNGDPRIEEAAEEDIRVSLKVRSWATPPGCLGGRYTTVIIALR